MKKLRASRLVIPSTLSVAVVAVVVSAGAGACSKEPSPEEEGFCIALDETDGGATVDCPDHPDGGDCPPGCALV